MHNYLKSFSWLGFNFTLFKILVFCSVRYIFFYLSLLVYSKFCYFSPTCMYNTYVIHTTHNYIHSLHTLHSTVRKFNFCFTQIYMIKLHKHIKGHTYRLISNTHITSIKIRIKYIYKYRIIGSSPVIDQINFNYNCLLRPRIFRGFINSYNVFRKK